MQLSEKKQEPIWQPDTVIHGVCGQCSVGCGLKLFSAHDGKTELFGDAEHPLNKGALCPKLLTLRAVTQGKRRIAFPCIRESARQPWRTVSWEEALNTLVSQLREHVSGAAPLVFAACGHEPLDWLAGGRWLAPHLPHATGPDAFLPRSWGPHGSLHVMFGVPGSQLASSSPRDWGLARHILLVGGDPAAETPVAFGLVQDVRDRGGTVVYIGDSAGMTAMRSSLALVVRPGTETLAVAGVVHGLLRDNMDVPSSVVGVDALRQRLEPFSPEAVAPHCGVPLAYMEAVVNALRHLATRVKPAHAGTDQVCHCAVPCTPTVRLHAITADDLHVKPGQKVLVRAVGVNPFELEAVVAVSPEARPGAVLMEPEYGAAFLSPPDAGGDCGKVTLTPGV